MAKRVASRVKPELPGGFNDYDPSAMVARRGMLETIARAFERYGFVPLDTPAVEFEDVLLGESGETEKQVFRLRSASEGAEGTRRLALRFDLTVPLSRYVAGSGDMVFPFRRYQVGDVFRGERPQAGRYRQFKQFDADVVGARSLLADAEVIAAMHASLLDLGVSRFKLRLNHRQILSGLAATLGLEARGECSVDELTAQLIRILDKLDGLGIEGVQAELTRAPRDPADPAPALGPPAIKRVRRYLELVDDTESPPFEEALAQPERRQRSNRLVLDRLRELLAGDETAAEGIAALDEILSHLDALGVQMGRVQLDPSIARGLDYYTGVVLETELCDLPEMGSVMSGGRYDNLVSRFTATPLPAVGASIGLDRLFAALTKLGMIPESATPIHVLVMVMDQDEIGDSLQLAQRLRAAGFSTDLYCGAERSFKAQMRYALRKGIRFLAIRGSDERAAGTVQLKDLERRHQVPVPLAQVEEALRNMVD